MTTFQRMIFDCQPDNMVTAGRAARWLMERPEHKDAIVSYGGGEQEVVFYVKRNRASISIREQMRAAPLTSPERNTP